MPQAPNNGTPEPNAIGATDVGRQRKHNEDHLLVAPRVDLYVVADGMGGHNAGEVASRLATKSVQNFFEATVFDDIPEEAEQTRSGASYEARRLVAAVRKANHDIFEISNTFREHRGMGSTIVAVHYERVTGQLHIAHVGDSRVYRVRGGAIEQLTRDHSLVSDAMMMKPELTQEELSRLPKNIITRALGMTAKVQVDLRSEPVQAGDTYLLCSDGLSGMVDDEQILEVLTITDDPAEAADLLVSMANEAGGTDNITALIIHFAEGKPVVSAAHTKAEPSTSPNLRHVLPASVAEALEAGAEVAWGADESQPSGGTCAKCDAALIDGNDFCVECGTRISSIP